MEQDKNNYQNGQVNDPGTNSAPGNPYSEYYREYIVDPEKQKNRPSKSKRLVSIILCTVSNMLMVLFCVMWISLVFQLLTGYQEVDVTTDSLIAVSSLLFIYLMVISLALAIVAKALYHKSLWAVINIILFFVILAILIISCLILPGKIEDNASERNTIITEALNSDVEELIGKYSFDVQDFDKDYKHHNGNEYDIWIFFSSEASEDQIKELDDFLEDLYDMDSSHEYKITFTIHPVYFEPDDDSCFVYLDTYNFEYDKLSPKPKSADIDRHMNIGAYPKRKTSHVPVELEKGQMLIVVR